MCQLRPEVALAKRPPYLSHLRDKNGRHEIDLLADLGRRGVVAIEFKAKSAPAPADAAHLYWLREQLGDKFLRPRELPVGQADALAAGAEADRRLPPQVPPRSEELVSADPLGAHRVGLQ